MVSKSVKDILLGIALILLGSWLYDIGPLPLDPAVELILQLIAIVIVAIGFLVTLSGYRHED
jgi:hypothetical protein